MNAFLTYMLAAAFLQNVVLTTGLGSSLMMRIVRRPRDILWFSLLLGIFTVITVLIFYPIDQALGNSPTVKLLRPLIVIGIDVILYVAVTLCTRRWRPELFARIRRLLSLAAFNNTTIGVALIINHKLNLSLTGSLGLALGATMSFLFISFLVKEGMDRLSHPDVPPSFRGTPCTLLYLAILALALFGFNPDRITWFLR